MWLQKINSIHVNAKTLKPIRIILLALKHRRVWMKPKKKMCIKIEEKKHIKNRECNKESYYISHKVFSI